MAKNGKTKRHLEVADAAEARAQLEMAAAAGDKVRYSLTLYVAGVTRRSATAIATIREFCDERLAGRYDLEVVDIYRNPDRAREGQVLAAPTLVKKLPLPLRRLIGDMSDKDRVLLSLGIHEDDGKTARKSGR